MPATTAPMHPLRRHAVRFLAVLGAGAALLAVSAGIGPGASQAQESAAEGKGLKTAIFAGGCFWCVEADFDKIDGVVETVSGYSGGNVPNPTYEEVSAGGTGHREVVRVTYDPDKVSYEQLAGYFFRTVDPTDDYGQFCDRGESYTTAIYATPEQEEAANAARELAQATLAQPVVTPILPAREFYPAEGYHQDYYENNSLKYSYYRWSCGRDARIKSLWGEAALKLPPPPQS